MTPKTAYSRPNSTLEFSKEQPYHFLTCLSKFSMVIVLVLKSQKLANYFFGIAHGNKMSILPFIIKIIIFPTMPPFYYHNKIPKNHGNCQKISKKIVLPRFFFIFFKIKFKKGISFHYHNFFKKSLGDSIILW